MVSAPVVGQAARIGTFALVYTDRLLVRYCMVHVHQQYCLLACFCKAKQYITVPLRMLHLKTHVAHMSRHKSRLAMPSEVYQVVDNDHLAYPPIFVPLYVHIHAVLTSCLSCASGTERVLGTLIGGWLAYGLVSACDNDGFLTAMLFVVAVMGNLIGKRLDLAYGVGKLMLLTFMAGMGRP